MTDALLEMIPSAGLPLLFLIVAIGCFGVPVPSSVALIMAGTLAAEGELVLISVIVVAFAGAIVGDNAGYLLGRLGGAGLERLMTGTEKRAANYERAVAFSERWGGLGVFFSRWLVTPLCPVINILSGAARLTWWRFAVWEMSGEAIWVCLYVGAGFVFSGSVAALFNLLAEAGTFVLVLAVAAGLGIQLWRALHRRQRGGAD